MIDFGSVVEGKTVRAVKIDGVYYIARMDIIVAVAKCDIKAASDIWTRRLTDLEKEEASYGCRKHQFGGIGQSETEVLTFDGALSLAMCVLGPVAREVRIQARRLLKKWLHDHTADQLMRKMTVEPQGALGVRSMEDLEMDRQERRVALREREALLPLVVKGHELAIREREAALLRAPATLEQLRIENHHTMLQGVQALCPGNVLDDRNRFLFMDRMMNIAHCGVASGGAAMITDGEGCPRSVSDIVAEMKNAINTKGIQQIGKVVAAKYRKKYGEDAVPPKQNQLVGGRNCPVNCFASKYHDLVREAIDEHLAAAATL